MNRPARRALAVMLAAGVLPFALPSAALAKQTPRGSRPAYAKHGPYVVGVTTLALPDREVEVFYPARKGSERGTPKASYDQRDALPDDMKQLIADEFNPRTELNAYRDLPASNKGPFPVVLFSHGFGGWRLENASLEAGIASWGFVVVAPDHFERGRAAIIRGQGTVDPVRDIATLLAALDLAKGASKRPHSELTGAVDARRVGVIGHSAGGGAALSALRDPHVKVAIGWAPTPPAPGPPLEKPVMIIGAAEDLVITPEAVAKVYDPITGPKRRVEIDHAGHNSFTDSCVTIRRGGGLIAQGRKMGVPEGLLNLGENGCEPGSLEPPVAWAVIQHFTVAELRSALRIDKKPVGLGDGIVDAFAGVTIRYDHRP